MDAADRKRQESLEADAVEEGRRRFREAQQHRLPTQSKAVAAFLLQSLEPLADAILAEQRALKDPEQRRKLPKYGTPLVSLDHEKLALITLGTIFNLVATAEASGGSPSNRTQVAYEIGQRCRLERLFDWHRARQIDVAKELMGRNRSRNARRRAERLAASVDDNREWARNFRAFHLGEFLLQLAVEHTRFDGEKVFALRRMTEDTGGRLKTPAKILLTERADEWLEKHYRALEVLAAPVHLPMIVPPVRWTALQGGGYLTTPVELVKRGSNRAIGRALSRAKTLSRVFAAVNILQETPWRINLRVCEVMRQVWEGGHAYFGLPTMKLQRLPEALEEGAPAEVVKKRKAERAQTYRLNLKLKGLRQIVAFRLAQCERLKDAQQFYFPYQLDHRGRAYPIPQVLHPQADDAGRALLEFATGKRLGKRGAHWLAIHLANCYGKDKVSFAERVNWVKENEADIVRFACDPLKPHRFWTEAKKPWTLLAACLEWRGYVAGDPAFESHIPVSMDGTCNGYQHLSAMGRDPVGGKATNLLPSDKPEDIYQEVAERVRRRVQADAETGCARARQWLGKIDRNVTKHATMTTPYGVKQSTIWRTLRDEDFAAHCDNPVECAQYLAKVLDKSIREVAVQAREIMDWLRKIARILAKANRGVCWHAPTGFVVFHESREPKEVRLTTAARTLVVYDDDETRALAPEKQANGIVAHFVHSFDAAHMMLTVNRLYREGLRHFAMIHDSYGVHACDVDRMNRVLREEFAKIYKRPVLQQFLREQRVANPQIKLCEPPPLGDLDLEGVLSSEYFFA